MKCGESRKENNICAYIHTNLKASDNKKSGDL